MAAITRVEVIEPSRLSNPEIEAWIDRLYAVHCEIFDGVSRDEFARYVVRSKADRTTIQISFGAEDQIAGYIAVHAFLRTFRDAPCTVLRAEAGLRRAYRGDGAPGSFFASQLLKMRLEYPGQHFYLGCLVHPSSYTALARDADEIWPHPSAETPADMVAFMMALGDEFHLEMVDERAPLVRRVGWITRDTEVERRYWAECENPVSRFYVDQNPGYVEGHGLLTLIPLGLGNLGRSLASWGGARVQKTLKRTLGSLERSVLRPRLGEDQAESLLQRFEQRTGLTLDGVRELGIVGKRYPVAARTLLFQAGERGDDLFVVVSGALVVLGKGEDGEEFVIDQLGPGQVVGEMAVLTGQPRSASVRAATDAVLLRLEPAEMRALLDAAPELRAQMWRYVGRRLFAERVRGVPALEGLGHAARRDWYDAGEDQELGRGASLTLAEDRVVVLSRGDLRAQGAFGWCSLSAPAAMTLPAGAELRALDDAHLALLPPTAPAQPPAMATRRAQ